MEVMMQKQLTDDMRINIVDGFKQKYMYAYMNMCMCLEEEFINGEQREEIEEKTLVFYLHVSVKMKMRFKEFDRYSNHIIN